MPPDCERNVSSSGPNLSVEIGEMKSLRHGQRGCRFYCTNGALAAASDWTVQNLHIMLHQFFDLQNCANGSVFGAKFYVAVSIIDSFCMSALVQYPCFLNKI